MPASARAVLSRFDEKAAHYEEAAPHQRPRDRHGARGPMEAHPPGEADQKGPWPLPRREGSLWIPTRRERGLADVALGGPASLD